MMVERIEAEGWGVVARLSPEDVQAKARAEAAALAALREAGTVPEACGPEMPVAPARGAFRVFAPREIVPGTQVSRRSGYGGRLAIAEADVFDAMLDAARRAAERHDRPVVEPLTSSQIDIGRHYRDLTERHAAGGMRCASLEAGRGGGGSGEFIDAFVAEGRELLALQDRIGAGAALVVRRVRPSKRGGASASVILDRALVDAVCLGQQTLSQVLKLHGWSADGGNRERLRLALAAALDRMYGYRAPRSTKWVDA